MHGIRLAIPLLALIGAAAFAPIAVAASFDCAKASTAVETLICSDTSLGLKDERLARAYAALLDGSPRASAAGIRTAQRAWLATRDTCAAQASPAPCVGRELDARTRVLETDVTAQAARIDAVIAGIPTSPARAAVALRAYDGALASAWLVYLQRFEPTAGVTKDEARTREARVVAMLKREDDFAADTLADVAGDAKDRASGKYTLMLLRMAIERAGYDDARADVHCFVFARHGELAYDAMGALYGSTRDSFAPICAPQGDLFEAPAWKQLDAAFDPLIEAATKDSGTMRFASFASWRVLALRATVSPLDFLAPKMRTAHPDPMAAIGGWKNAAAWPADQRRAALAAIGPARDATAQWLMRAPQLPAAKAKDAAAVIVAAWVVERLDYASDSLSDDGADAGDAAR